MKNKKVTMQEQLTELVGNMRKDGFNFKEQTPTFKWFYPEMPEVHFLLQILEPEIPSLEEEKEVQEIEKVEE